MAIIIKTIKEKGSGDIILPISRVKAIYDDNGVRLDELLAESGKKQIQTDWEQEDTTKVDYIKNKPSLDYVPASGGTIEGTLVVTSGITIGTEDLIDLLNTKVDNEDNKGLVDIVNGLTVADRATSDEDGLNIVDNYLKKVDVKEFRGLPVDVLPTTDISYTTLYLVKDIDPLITDRTAWIRVEGSILIPAVDDYWEKVGMTVDLEPYAKKEDIPTEISELNNDVGFITNVVSDLVNYYDKTTVDTKISAIPKFSIKPVDNLPTEDIKYNIIYLLKIEGEEYREEWIYVDGSQEIPIVDDYWYKIGETSTDLELYATEIWVEGNFLAVSGGTVSGNTNFTGTLTINGESISIEGHKHEITDINNLQDTLDLKIEAKDPVVTTPIETTTVDRAISDEFGNNINERFNTLEQSKSNKILLITSDSTTPTITVEASREYNFNNPLTSINVNLSVNFDKNSLCLIDFDTATSFTATFDVNIKGLYTFSPNMHYEIILKGKYATVNAYPL